MQIGAIPDIISYTHLHFPSDAILPLPRADKHDAVKSRVVVVPERIGGRRRAAEPGSVDFSRDVRPILARHCFKCHGPDDTARQASLRLDRRDAATGPAESGAMAIVPGKPDESALIRRVSSDDDDEVMPPPAEKKPLSAAERETLRRWIADGAEYKPHWAFVAPVQSALPAVAHADWPRNSIDHFVLSRLEREGLSPRRVPTNTRWCGVSIWI